jgi:hypothetical protein
VYEPRWSCYEVALLLRTNLGVPPPERPTVFLQSPSLVKLWNSASKIGRFLSDRFHFVIQIHPTTPLPVTYSVEKSSAHNPELIYSIFHYKRIQLHCSHALIHRAEPFLRSRQFCSYSRASQHFIEPEGSLSRSQQTSTGQYPVLDQFNPYYPIISL